MALRFRRAGIRIGLRDEIHRKRQFGRPGEGRGGTRRVFKATRAKLAAHPIEDIGAKLRDMMPWIKKGALVDKTKN
ncbi:MAG: ketol-acid reductoisomerase [Tardiphaga sp.]|jgi:hypothetical protein|nr:ketol-acid reductoisomerase [Tardiphaga sp.]